MSHEQILEGGVHGFKLRYGCEFRFPSLCSSGKVYKCSVDKELCIDCSAIYTMSRIYCEKIKERNK